MKWISRCDKQPLEQLLREELDDRKRVATSAHLDECETCQRRLTELAAGANWWLEAGRWLEPAAGGVDPYTDELVDTDYDDDDRFPLTQQHLLDAGLLEPSPREDAIGLLGRYEVRRIIGAGGTGIVLQATDSELNRTVAIKMLAPVLAANGSARRRFAREGQAVAAVAHENVVAVHHVEAGGRTPYLVMQYIDGDSLQDLVIRSGPLEVTTALRMTAQLAAALEAAHDQGLVHRDVKPANILVGAAGQRVWITDFGLARAVDDASLTRTGFIAGTPHYMSPEQARGETVRSSSDLFGLGSVLYFMLTGRPPFRAERTLAILNRICNEPHRPVREVNPDVPRAVATLLDRLLEKQANDRFNDAAAVREECLRLLAAHTSSDDVLVIKDDTPPRPRPRWRRRFAVVSAVMLFVAASAVCVFVASQFRPRYMPVDGSSEAPEQGMATAYEEAEYAGPPEEAYAHPPVATAPQVPAFAAPEGAVELSSLGDVERAGLPSTAPVQTVEPPQPQDFPPQATRHESFADPSESSAWMASFSAVERELNSLQQQVASQRDVSAPGELIHSDHAPFTTQLQQIEAGLSALPKPVRKPTTEESVVPPEPKRY